jgi:chromosomal replication initiation ATPase DnaA
MVFSREIFFVRLNHLTGVTQREIIADIREKKVMRARYIAMLSLRMRGWSSAKIGRFLDRDPTTILSSVRTARKHYEEDSFVRNAVDKMVGDD